MSATPYLAPSPGRDLQRGQTLCMDGDRRGLKLHCLAGQVWITQPGDKMDHLIPAGHDFTVTRAGRVVIQALTAWANISNS